MIRYYKYLTKMKTMCYKAIIETAKPFDGGGGG